MMLNIFLPIRLGNNFILKKKVIIVYITEYNFSALLIYATGTTREIIKSIFYDFERQENIYDIEFLLPLLSKFISSWEHDDVKIIFPTNTVIFRSLLSPFGDIEKIKMTIPFDLESILPFQLSEAAVDVIYQNKITNNEKNKVLAIITKEEYLNFYREVFKKINLNLTAISVDCVQLIQYNLHYYRTDKSSYIILYKNNNSFLFLFFNKNELVGVKSIIADEKDKNQDKLLILQTLTVLSQELNFSLQNLTVFLVGLDNTNDLLEEAIQKYQLNLTPYESNYQEQMNAHIKIKGAPEESKYKNNICFAIFASLLAENESFNLAHKEFNDIKSKILYRQVICGLLTTALLYIALLCFNIFDIYSINSVIEEAEKKLITILKKEFSLSNKYIGSVDTALNESKKIMETITQNLPIPAIHGKFLFINLFDTMVKNLSKDIKGLIIQEMKWKLGIDSPTSLTLTGEVADFDSLHLLEESLKKSNLFVQITPQQDRHFNFNLVLIS